MLHLTDTYTVRTSTVHILIRNTHSGRPHPHQTSIRGPESCASSALTSTAEQSHKTTTRPTADQRTRATSDLDPFSYAEQAQSAMPATLVPTSAQPLCFPSMAGCSGCQPAPWSSPSLTKSSYPRRTVSSCTRPAPNARPMSSLSPQAAGRASIDAA